jgi:hypothetical protein
LYGECDKQPEGDAAGVESDVERRRVPTAHEMLVNLVCGGIGDPENERGSDAAAGSQEQEAEHCVLGDVCALAQHLVPRAKPRRERGDRREREDHRRPDDDRPPELELAH